MTEDLKRRATPTERDLSCPESPYYGDCPKFRKSCDGINCWSKYTWQQQELHKARMKWSKDGSR